METNITVVSCVITDLRSYSRRGDRDDRIEFSKIAASLNSNGIAFENTKINEKLTPDFTQNKSLSETQTDAFLMILSIRRVSPEN